jgi:hypothetical protein
MPPIQLSRRERASLHKILYRPCQAGEIPADHEEKFVNYDLARKRVLLLYITPLGQIEVLRQRFRRLKAAGPNSSRSLPAAPPLRRLLTDQFRESA